jgi:RNA polymerase sigma factor for flagellar operon FliA
MATSPRGLPETATESVDKRVEEGLPLVGHYVREMLNKVPTHVNRDDLTSAAMMALALAAQAFDPTRGVPFARYAAIRIRGALIDELRGMDFGARWVRGRAREVEAVRNQLTALLGRHPRPDEIAAAIGIGVAELAELDVALLRARQLSLEGIAGESEAALPADRDDGPEALILLRERLGYLHDAIDELPERMRFVIISYFFQQRRMADIGAELGVTASRASQLRAAALLQLRDGLNTNLDPPAGPGPVAEPVDPARRTYAQAVGRGTLHSRLAKTTVRAEVRPEVRQVAASGCRVPTNS